MLHPVVAASSGALAEIASDLGRGRLCLVECDKPITSLLLSDLLDRLSACESFVICTLQQGFVEPLCDNGEGEGRLSLTRSCFIPRRAEYINRYENRHLRDRGF